MLIYIIYIFSNIDPLKPKVMNLTYITKVAFNITGMGIYSTLAISLNTIFNELKTLSNENHDSLLKNNDQLHLLIINDISLLGNKMLSFIDHRLRIIKHVHNQLMGGFNVIMASDFYQTPMVQDSWIF
jgi:hypothetical protein